MICLAVKSAIDSYACAGIAGGGGGYSGAMVEISIQLITMDALGLLEVHLHLRIFFGPSLHPPLLHSLLLAMAMSSSINTLLDVTKLLIGGLVMLAVPSFLRVPLKP